MAQARGFSVPVMLPVTGYTSTSGALAALHIAHCKLGVTTDHG